MHSMNNWSSIEIQTFKLILNWKVFTEQKRTVSFATIDHSEPIYIKHNSSLVRYQKFHQFATRNLRLLWIWAHIYFKKICFYIRRISTSTSKINKKWSFQYRKYRKKLTQLKFDLYFIFKSLFNNNTLSTT